MKRLLKYLRGYEKETVLAPLGKLCEATLELIVPLIIAAIIDRGIANGDRGYTVLMSLLLMLLGAVGLGFSVVAQYFAAKASVGFITATRRAMFTRLETLSYADADSLGTSTMITRMTADATKLQTGVNLTLRLLLRSPFVVFGAMIMALIIDVEAGLSFALVIPLLSVVVFGIMLVSMPLYKKVQGGVDKILSRTRDNLSGVRCVRAFGKEERETIKFREENATLTAAQNRVGRISALMNPLTYVIINLGIVLLIYTGALRVDSGELTQGEVIALYNYMSQILVELIKLANLIITISRALASGSRIADVLELQSSQKFGEREVGVSPECAVQLKSASLRYGRASEDSLSGISLSAMRGETVGIIGGTGSGKSSLVNLIPRLYDATGGEVLIEGSPISEFSKEALTRKIGIVPQRATLFAGSVADNMRIGAREATDEEINEALLAAQAIDFVNEKGGLSAEIEAGGRNLSGGQKQRLTIARALVKKPEILILDDSASALDYATDARLRRAISDFSKDMTVFIVSQRAASVMHADKILVLDDGHAVAEGTHRELLDSSEVYREIYETQFGEGASE
ncbi:MAG: ABC transporter ATP-binding protein [Clostridia bacterium]|nr:ABC transporter ATP-binding protein [Clostridia bacterium]